MARDCLHSVVQEFLSLCHVYPLLKWPLQLGLDVRIAFQRRNVRGGSYLPPKWASKKHPWKSEAVALGSLYSQRGEINILL